VFDKQAARGSVSKIPTMIAICRRTNASFTTSIITTSIITTSIITTSIITTSIITTSILSPHGGHTNGLTHYTGARKGALLFSLLMLRWA